jgi:hypothetical protein
LQVVASPQPGRIKRSTSLAEGRREGDEALSGREGEEGKHEHVRVSLEGVAQLGQLLCRMMLFPIFRSNNEYMHVCADRPDGVTSHTVVAHLSYFAGVRVLPRVEYCIYRMA